MTLCRYVALDKLFMRGKRVCLRWKSFVLSKPCLDIFPEARSNPLLPLRESGRPDQASVRGKKSFWKETIKNNFSTKKENPFLNLKGNRENDISPKSKQRRFCNLHLLSKYFDLLTLDVKNIYCQWSNWSGWSGGWLLWECGAFIFFLNPLIL